MRLPYNPDRKLITLVILAVILNVGHTIDHIARGDLHWPLTLDSAIFILIVLVIFTLAGAGLFLYIRNKVGPAFWAIVAGTGVAFGWLSHFSPFTDQRAQVIFSAYQSTVAGWLALACLFALMVLLVMVTIYASYLWMLNQQRQSSSVGRP
ncbi:MAG: hypothetical protein ACREJU_20550 [Nitrospiraceae bacterium]